MLQFIKRNVYVGKIQDVDDSQAYIHFLAHNGTLIRNSKCREPKVMVNGFLLMIFYASIQSLWPLNSYLRYVQGRLILFPEIFKNGKNVVNVKTENTLVTYVQITLLLYLLIFYIFLYYFIIVIPTSVGR